MGHRGEHDVADPVFHQLVKVRNQIELQTFGRAGQGDRTDREDKHQHDQQDHHDLRDLFDAVSQPLRTDTEGRHDNDHREQDQDSGACEHVREGGLDPRRIHSDKSARGHQVGVVQHPACDHRVEHHEQVVAGEAEPLEAVPVRAFAFELVEGADDAASASAPDGVFAHQDGQTQQGQARQVD